MYLNEKSICHNYTVSQILVSEQSYGPTTGIKPTCWAIMPLLHKNRRCNVVLSTVSKQCYLSFPNAIYLIMLTLAVLSAVGHAHTREKKLTHTPLTLCT